MNARVQLSVPQLTDVAAIGEATQREMFSLFERYYDGTGFKIFRRDLLAKDRVVLLRDHSGALRGFSTLAVYSREYRGHPLKVVFSGDTIIDEPAWGSHAFAFAWLRWVGALNRWKFPAAEEISSRP